MESGQPTSPLASMSTEMSTNATALTMKHERSEQHET